MISLVGLIFTIFCFLYIIYHAAKSNTNYRATDNYYPDFIKHKKYER